MPNAKKKKKAKAKANAVTTEAVIHNCIKIKSCDLNDRHS